jgi:formylglycine-generating enzyme required for sulfatase activity
VGSLKEGQAVHVLGRVKGEKWYLVEHGGKQGYVAADLLRPKGEQAAVRPVSPPSTPKPAAPAVGVYPGTPKPGTVFKDCAECPEMVVIPAGEFTMGSPPEERRWAVSQGAKEEWVARETPQHRVMIAKPFAAGKFEVTRAEYGAFARDAGHGAGDGCFVFKDEKWEKDAGKDWRSPGYAQTERDPVVCVSWSDAKAYVEWLTRKTGKTYRLLTEAEWEYAARAGTATARYWGDDRDNEQGCNYANGADRTAARLLKVAETKNRFFMCEDGREFTSPAGLYRANSFGLHDMLGNVWEWVEDCWNESYAGAPSDGTAWLSGNCGLRVLRGGSWFYSPRFLRSANRNRRSTDNRYIYDGFRVARTLN